MSAANPARGEAELRVAGEMLVLTRGGHLYVTRRFEFGLRNELGLGSENADDDSEAAQLPLDPQMLSLELQRSLDFYESHFDEGAIGDLIIAPAGAQANLFAAELGQSTGLRIGMFNLFDLVDVSRVERILHTALEREPAPTGRGAVVALPARFARPPQSFAHHPREETTDGDRS